mmetsp:Transcript_54857/g.128243  ORF Transcript_54857/g.128243 Transcript_54857/m.128243 type:complete len:246 (-) Transcript_54857:184-921(-)
MAKKGIDYSKWDNFKDSDEEDDEPAAQQQAVPAQPHDQLPPDSNAVPAGLPADAKPMAAHDLPESTKAELIKDHPEMAAKAGLITPTTTNKQNTKRKQYFHQGQLVYEWEQGLDEVNIYITPPPGIKANMFDIQITSDHLTVGLKGNKEKFLNHNLGAKCKHSESYWTLEDTELHITLTKLAKGVPWDAALEGHQPLDPMTATEVRKDIMRERFQEEHPGFDFSNAEFNGNVPDASKFMGGVGYS